MKSTCTTQKTNSGRSRHNLRRAIVSLVLCGEMIVTAVPALAQIPGAPAAPGAVAPPSAADVPLLPGEKEATKECQKYPPNKKFKWELRGELDLMTMLGAMAPMLCRPFVVPGNIRQNKATIIAPNTMTAPEAYRMFLSALESMGLTVQPEGKVLKIIESNRARESAIPIYSGEETPPTRDQYVTRLLRLEHVDINDVKTVLDRLRSRDGDITAYPPTNTLVITDLGTNIRRMEEVVSQLDIPMGGEKIWVIKLHSVSATEMATLLQSVFGVGKSGGGSSGSSTPNRPRTSFAPTTPPATPATGTAPATAGDSKGPPGVDLAISQIIPDDPRGLLIIVSTEKAYQRILALVRRIDQQMSTSDSPNDRVHVVPLANANVDDLASTLAGLGASVSRSASRSSTPGSPATSAPAATSSSGGATGRGGLFESEVKISADKATNSLVILASGRDYITIRDLIKKLDLPRRQVFVEAAILEISVDKARNLGVAFHGGTTVGINGSNSLFVIGSEGQGSQFSSLNTLLFNPAALSGLGTGLFGPGLTGANEVLGLPAGRSIPSFGVLVQMLQTNGDVNVVSMPHVLTTDNEKASILVGENRPFPAATSALSNLGALGGAAGGAAATAAAFNPFVPVNRQDVALKMDITPHVNDSDFVRLEIDNEISDVIGESQQGPITAKRTVKSQVTVRDQQSIVLGGLIKDKLTDTVEKVPVLGDIPILGYLFKRTRRTVTKQNLLIVLTPYVIKDPNDLRRIFERKVRERREFMEQYSAFRDERDYEANVDYRRKRGALEEINRAALEAEQEAAELRKANAALYGADEDGVVEVPAPPRRLPPQPATPAPTPAPAPQTGAPAPRNTGQTAPTVVPVPVVPVVPGDATTQPPANNSGVTPAAPGTGTAPPGTGVAPPGTGVEPPGTGVSPPAEAPPAGTPPPNGTPAPPGTPPANVAPGTVPPGTPAPQNAPSAISAAEPVVEP